MSKKFLKLSAFFLLVLFALIGLVLTAGFLALKMGWTKTAGQIDFNDRYFKTVAEKISQIEKKGGVATAEEECRLFLISSFYPESGQKLVQAYLEERTRARLLRLLSAADIYLKNNQQYQEGVKMCEKFSSSSGSIFVSRALYPWQASEEWLALKPAIVKDSQDIIKASEKAGIKPRLMVSMLVVEQLRLFNSEREVFKQVFQPLKILGNQSQFSWGVMGLKEETAKEVEVHLVDRNSPYYLGAEKENLLKFSRGDSASERFERLVDEHEHYYSYLYASLLIKQLTAQWEKAGFAINDRPEIIATLFNLGFSKSTPKANPQVGGAEIEIGGRKYTFGSLAYEFYYSGELAEEFPL